MFNFKKYVSAADLSTKVSPEDIPGRNIQEKASYISEYLDREIGEKLASGEITIDTAYKLLAETKVANVPQQFEFLERYRSNITNLIQSACSIKSSLDQTGLSRDQISELVIKKLLERVNQVFIPELVELSRTSKRNTPEATEILSRLPEYQDPDQIAAIKSWISREVEKEIKEIIDEFLDIKNRALKIPSFDEKDLLTMLTNTPAEALKVLFPDRRKTSANPLPSKFTDPNVIRDVEGINDEVQKLSRKTSVKGDTGWTRVLALSGKMNEEEISKWKQLVDHPVVFNLFEIIKNAGILNSAMTGSGTEQPAKLKEAGFRSPLIRSKYREFFRPYLDPSTGLPFVSESEMRYIQEKFNGADPRSIAYDVDRRMDFIKRSQKEQREKYSRARLYDCITNGYDGPGLNKLIKSPELCLDEAGLAIQYYYRSISGSNINNFLNDLSIIGLSEHYEALSEVGMEVDPNYEGLRLITRSKEEAKIIQILRREFGIDAIPYQVLVPVPTDCPTNSNNFDIDFMIYVDVLEYIDPVTFLPVIKSKVMFVGEYFGFNGDQEKTLVDRGKPWVDPDGNVYTPEPRKSVDGQILKEYDPLTPGSKVREKHIYDLKTLWKKRTYETLAHIVGTDALSFEKPDLKSPYYSIAQKLDEKDIIYTFPGCSTYNNFCKAKKMIENSVDFELKENINNPEYHRRNLTDERKKCIRAIDSALIHYKLQHGLKVAKQEFAGKSGFDRKTIKEHHDYFISIKTNIDNALKIIASPNSSTEAKMSAQRMVEHNQNEMRTLENSPLIDFKRRVDAILQESENAFKIKQFEELRDRIENGTFTASLTELRAYLVEIDEGIFGFVPDPNKE
jgi:hypothetical protein